MVRILVGLLLSCMLGLSETAFASEWLIFGDIHFPSGISFSQAVVTRHAISYTGGIGLSASLQKGNALHPLAIEWSIMLLNRGYNQVDILGLMIPLLLRFHVVPAVSLAVGPYVYPYYDYTKVSDMITGVAGLSSLSFPKADAGIMASVRVRAGGKAIGVFGDLRSALGLVPQGSSGEHVFLWDWMLLAGLSFQF